MCNSNADSQLPEIVDLDFVHFAKCKTVISNNENGWIYFAFSNSFWMTDFLNSVTIKK